MATRVGISLTLDAEGRLRQGRRTHSLDADTTRAVVEAGGTALGLPSDADPAALVEDLHGLLIPGGDDFPPPRPYPPEVRFTPVPEAQLAFDAALLDLALARGLPVLGICYGMQLLVRQLGGRLLYHLPSDQPEARSHQLPEASARHGLRLESDSRLARILGPEAAEVNSRHHQGVAAPGPRLRVCGRAEDGVVEAVEAPGEAFVLGVQWHPESLEAEHRRRIFGAFVAAAAARARRQEEE